MLIALQLVVFALIGTSSIILISVPIVFASSEGWLSNKNVIFSDTSLWIGLVFLVAILDSVISLTSLSLCFLHPKVLLLETLRFNMSLLEKNLILINS